MTFEVCAWDDDEVREPYTPEQWAEVKDFVGEPFTEIDRPNEWLLRLSIEVRGDESGGTAWAFASELTVEQQRALMQYAAEEIVRQAHRLDRLGHEPPGS